MPHVFILAPPHDWSQGIPLFIRFELDLPGILIEFPEPSHFRQLNRFHEPVPSFRYMLWPSPSAPWLKHLSYICDSVGMCHAFEYIINQLDDFIKDFFNFLWQKRKFFYFLSFYKFSKSSKSSKSPSAKRYHFLKFSSFSFSEKYLWCLPYSV